MAFAKVMTLEQANQASAVAMARRAHEDEIKARREVGKVPTSRDEFDDMRAAVHQLAKRDQDATKRVKVHLVFIAITVVLGTIVVFVPGLVPFTSVLTGVPPAMQEITDWIHRWLNPPA